MDLKYRADIDGLRGIAVLSVVLFHAFPKTLPGGFVGVDVFFVISGFLISSIIFLQVTKNQFSISEFYYRRAKRILPALIVVLISSLIFGYLLLFPNEYMHLGKQVIGSSLFANNLFLWNEAGYFDVSSSYKPLLHLWSLGIEEQFYLFWPVILLFAVIRRINPMLVIVPFMLISFIACIMTTQKYNDFAFYMPISRAWELVFGACLAYFCMQKESENNKNFSLIGSSISFFCLILLVVIFFIFNQQIIHPGWLTLIPVFCTGIILTLSNTWSNRFILSFSWLINIGLISYPLYLWHWVLLSFANIIYAGNPSTIVVFGLVSLSFILSYLTYFYIEKPIRFSGLKLTNNRLVASRLIWIFLLIGVTAIIIVFNQGLPKRAWVKKQSQLTDDIETFAQYKTKILPCNLQDKATKVLSLCYQSKVGLPNKAIWGDSHAEHLLPGIINHDKHNNWILIGQSACPPIMNVKAHWKQGQDKCVKANNIALNALLSTKSIDTVLLASLGSFYISDVGFAADHKGKHEPSGFILEHINSNNKIISKAQIFAKGLDVTINKLEKAGKKIILLVDVPELPFMPNGCISRPLGHKNACLLTQKEVLNRQKEYKNILYAVLEKHPKVQVYDPTQFICKNPHCTIFYKGHLLYRDSHHLSLAGSDFIMQHFFEKHYFTEI